MQSAEGVRVVRCPSCQGLRGLQERHAERQSRLCGECRRGDVIPRSRYHNYWLSRFTREEISEMARAIWG